MEVIFNQFFTVGLDLEHPLQIRDLHLTKDALDLTLKQGTLYLAQQVAGEVTGAIFEGEGVIKVVPPNKMERKSLGRAYGKEVLEESFTEAVLRFNDGTGRTLQAGGKPGPATGPDPTSTWAARSKLQYNSDDPQLDFLESHFNGLQGRDFLIADVNTSAQKWISLNYRGRSSIEIGVYHERSMGVAGKKMFEDWCQFHRKEAYDAKGNYNLLPEQNIKDSVALRNVDMTVEIPNTKSVLVDAKLQIEALAEGVRLVRFRLVNNIDASSWDEKGRPVTVTLVADAAGAPLPYIHKWHELLVLLPQPLAKGAKSQIQVKTTEDTIIQLTPASYAIYTTYPWFPQIGHNGGRYTFDWVVKVAKPMKATGSGDLVKAWEEGKMNCGEWRSLVPVQFPSFIFGEFNITDGSYKRQPPQSGEVGLRLYSITGGMVAIKGNKESILFNVQQGLKNYESIFGPYPYGDLDITQMPSGLGFSQSPPGILFLSGVLKGGGGGGDVDQILFHELAHQWWGNQVGWASPEDDWISESWAEYGAGLMTQGIDPKRFRLKLEDWKRQAIEADPKGTIATAWHSEARTGLIYSKGPYVVHMLRTWMGWEKFTKLASTIQSKYKNQDINTDTLARESGSIMGYNMFPFFDQWIRDQGIPKVHYSWSASPDSEGKFLVTVRLRQEDEAAFKLLMVPISFDFGKGEPTVVTKPILKPTTEIQVRVPARPKDVRVDDEGSQLATFIQDKT